jgi:aminoglycoside 6-adenylyltransferase
MKMRSEAEMMDLILSTARADQRIRVVELNGSRTNANAPRDRFQDYDIVYFVTDMDSFLKDHSWVDIFGKRIIMQMPEAMSLFPREFPGTFAYLMIFEDGNRIDLTLRPLSDLDRGLPEDTLSVILLDKDNRLPPRPPPGDEQYWVKKPSPEFFDDCCNEFWWVSTYAAKGLARKELLYAAEALNSLVRPQLLRMLSWQVGIATHFSVSVGKFGKYLDKYIPAETWDRLLQTYRNDTAEALRGCQALFRESSRAVAEQLGFTYPDYAENVAAFNAQMMNS